MPVAFLSHEQAACYGRYNREPDEAQLFRYFHLDDADRERIVTHRGDHNRLGFALQLGVADSGCLSRYRVPATRHLHQQEIKQQYGYREFSEVRFRLTRWLYERAWLAFERPSVQL